MVEESDAVDVPVGPFAFCNGLESAKPYVLRLSAGNRPSVQTNLRGNQIIHAWTRNKFVVDTDETRRLGIVEMSASAVRKSFNLWILGSYNSKSWISSGDMFNS